MSINNSNFSPNMNGEEPQNSGTNDTNTNLSQSVDDLKDAITSLVFQLLGFEEQVSTLDDHYELICQELQKNNELTSQKFEKIEKDQIEISQKLEKIEKLLIQLPIKNEKLN